MSDQSVPIAFQGEMMLIGWGDSSSRGRTVTFMIDEESGDHPFKHFTVKDGKKVGQRFMAAMVQLDTDEKPLDQSTKEKKEEKPYGKKVNVLHKTGWFYKQAVVSKAGKREEFRSWLMDKTCSVCGSNHNISLIGTDSGYSGAPVCEGHVDVEYAALAASHVRLLKEWISESIAQQMGCKSLGYVEPAKLIAWAKDNGLLATLPSAYVDDI